MQRCHCTRRKWGMEQIHDYLLYLRNNPGAQYRRSSQGIKLHVPVDRRVEQRLGFFHVLTSDSGYIDEVYPQQNYRERRAAPAAAAAGAGSFPSSDLIAGAARAAPAARAHPHA
ncbi:hypothetical protein EVAR_39331_1 [Eumeta japonica]|uniref:Uncharacterized protein n=1 Tax=Eumeta variegata TaxID=151549 RepID=A0A4C1WP70_EUMVA|nr:hypothetical protein EVAR_39331_1 [Eumeta japonica]